VSAYEFTVVIERQPEGGYMVCVPALPGCYSAGSTVEEARAFAVDAIQAYCASLTKHGEPIPVELPGDVLVSRFSVSLDPPE
jgi:predicted RNase H-like HicB family nuclease